jgi:hypothetical protein
MSRNKLYLGKAGQYIAMSEFLIRRWNVAMPEVDVGDDIFVVKDATGEFARIQVKTSTVKNNKLSYGVQFRLPFGQLETEFRPDLIYFFVIHHDSGWNRFVIIKRDELYKKVQIDNVGTKSGDYVQLYFSINESGNQVNCSSVDFTSYLNNFTDFPTINHDSDNSISRLSI